MKRKRYTPRVDNSMQVQHEMGILQQKAGEQEQQEGIYSTSEGQRFSKVFDTKSLPGV